MDRKTFESQKAFASEKKPSMHRRCVDNDYTGRRMYMITMVTEERRPLFGRVVGHSEAQEPSPDAPHIELSPLGERIADIWQTIGLHHPEVRVVAVQLMPDHLHAVLYVRRQMEKPLGKVLLGVKQACNQAFRELMPVELVAVAQQHARQSRDNGLLFAKNFNDQILLRDGQLERWLFYLKDNPRRPLIYLQENGFTDLAKPGGRRMEACASGQLLILAPWEHHNEKLLIKRGQCLALNDMARAICGG